MTDKACKECGETQSVERFYRRRRSPDGLQPFCKGCMQRKARERYQRDPTPHREASRRDREKNPDRVSDEVAKWRKVNLDKVHQHERDHRRRHPDKHRARVALKTAVKEGKLYKPSNCSDCGGEFAPEHLDGHHSDYEKALDVAWLCHPCHVERHRKEGTYAWAA